MIKSIAKKIIHLISNSVSAAMRVDNETQLLAIGVMLCNQQRLMNSSDINDYEFKIFSQFGDDGIIQYLVKNIAIENKVFVEFGVENYLESTTRFLMMNNNWSGFVMDSSEAAMNNVKKQPWFWKYSLTCKAAFVDRDNINELMSATGLLSIGLLHIDIDGNDYHVLTAMDLSKLNPSIIIMEYNSLFGDERSIVVPYKKSFNRTQAHYSNLYAGASLAAMNYAAVKKGYALVASNLAGNNAYFVRNDLLNEKVKACSVMAAYKRSRFRESRNKDYSLSFIADSERLDVIKGLDVLNVETNAIEKI